MELKCETVERIMKVNEKISHIRWEIQISPDEHRFKSGPFKLNDESNHIFKLILNREDKFCQFSLTFNHLHDNGNKECFQNIEFKFWIEYIGDTTKYRETEVQHKFDQGNEKSGCHFKLLQFFTSENLDKSGGAIICGEFRQKISEELQLTVKEKSKQNLQDLKSQKEEAEEFFLLVEGKRLKVPRMKTVAHSKIIKQMMEVENCKRTKNVIIEIKDRKFEVMKIFVDYIHNGYTDNLGKFANDFFSMGIKYKDEQMKTDSLNEMAKTLDKENVFHRLKIGFIHEKQILKDSAIDYITHSKSDLNIRQIMTSGDWFKLVSENKILATEITNAVFDRMDLFTDNGNEVSRKKQKLG